LTLSAVLRNKTLDLTNKSTLIDHAGPRQHRLAQLDVGSFLLGFIKTALIS